MMNNRTSVPVPAAVLETVITDSSLDVLAELVP